MFYDYADSGSWTESTYRANEGDFQSIKLRQRVAVNMENRSTAVTMVGQAAKMPVAIAPVGLWACSTLMARSTPPVRPRKFGIPFTLSTMSICSIEDIAEHTTAPFWFQLYMMRDRDAMARMIQRAKAARLGPGADAGPAGHRPAPRDLKNGLTAPPRPTLANLINPPPSRAGASACWARGATHFGNLVGHVKEVGDMKSPASLDQRAVRPAPPGPTSPGSRSRGRQAHPLQGHPGRRSDARPPPRPALTPSSATTAAASSTARPAPSPALPPS